MSETIAFWRQGLMLVVWLSAPPLLVAVIVGIVVSLIQTVLSVQDQSLVFVSKLFAVAVTVALLGRWIGLELLSLAELSMQAISTISHHGGTSL